MRVVLLALLLTFSGASAAFAFTAGTGFSASVYANAPAGLAGVAFDGATLYAVSPSDGTIYRGAGTAPVALAPLAVLGGSPTGIALTGGALYVARSSMDDIVRVDPALGTWASVASVACPNGVAADAASGDLFVSTCTSIYRVTSPATVPVVSKYADLVTGGIASYGITVGADGDLYVAVPSFGQVWRVPGPASTAAKGPVAYVAAARGVTLVGQYLFVSSGDGSITKAPLPELGGANIAALTGGDPGDLASLGADGCVYASQGSAIVRLGDASGGCDLVAAAPPPPPPSLTLERVTTGTALVGGGDQAFTATLAGAATLGGVSVTFTVSGANSLTRTTTTAPNGVATFAYSATNTGTDHISATAVVGGGTIASNVYDLAWPRAFDTAAPTITYAVTGDHGASFACPRADIGLPGVTEYCGWYTSAPTITWAVTPNGASGIDWSRTSCPAFTLLGTSPLDGTPVTCIAYNGDGTSAALQVRLQSVAAPPTIAASATTSDGAPYSAGAPTRLPVTVSFACDSALGSAGVVACTAPTTVSSDGTTSVSGSVIDVAGTIRTATFGPVVVDTHGPTIVATATAGGDPYAYGTWSRTPVTLTFSCGDATGVASCPAPVTLAAPGTVAVTATDVAGNVTHASFGPIEVDLAAPVTTLVVNGDAVTLDATDDTSGVASITYAVDGGAPLTVSGAHVAFSLATGPHTVTYGASDVAGNMEAARTASLTVTRIRTALAVTSGPFVATGARVAARLTTTGGAPVAGETVAFAAGGVTRSATTDSGGVAVVDLGLAPGAYTLAASYAGTPGYFPSSASATPLTVYAMTRFVVWAPNATPGARVQFYGDDWSKQIADKKLRGPLSHFKGYADGVFDAYWTGRSGDVVKAPRSVPAYIGVVLATSAHGVGDAIVGDVAGVAVLRVTSGTDGRLGDRAFGTVLGIQTP